MKRPSTRTALIAAVIVALGAFVLLRIGGAVAQSGCTQPIPDRGTVAGTWNADCLSQNNPTEPTNPPSGVRYARYYTFTLAAPADITIDLTSDTDTYMYLMQGTGTNGAVLHENDDVISGNTNSRISETLSAGDYTIEATTYRLATTGSFTLTISGIPAAPTPTTVPGTPTPTTQPATPTPVPTVRPAPTQPSVPADVLNRLTALETVVATQQELLSTLDSKITALDGRIAALEAKASTPTPTVVPISPTSTPTPVQAHAQTIIFSDLNWSSAQLQNRIAQYLLEKGYGYPTDVRLGSTLPLLNSLRNGDTHVTMEIWLPNQNEAWNEALAAGEVFSPGLSLGYDWQSAFVIPKYLQEQYPNLDSVEDLKEQKYKDLFKMAGTGDKARLLSCVIGWACEEVNKAQVTGYGLDDHVAIVNPGDGAALNADLYGAYERKEPWLGYQWGTSDPALKLDLVRLEEPPYNTQCWSTTKACGYQDATILIGVNSSLTQEAPDVVEMLRHWDFDVEQILKPVFRWQDANPEADTNATVLWWLKNNADIWSQWVTDEAAVAIQAALDADEIPGGWPTR